jgi:Tol biopolymer transport system component
MRPAGGNYVPLYIRQIGLAAGFMCLVLLAMLGCSLADPTASGESTSRSLAHVQFSDWSAPVLLTGDQINTPYTEQNPFMSPDERTLYFTSNRPEPKDDGIADQNIWVSKRQTRHDPWGPPTLVTALNSTGYRIEGDPMIYGNELGSKITIDGHLLFFFSNRDGNNDIYMSYRSNPRDDFHWSTPRKVGKVGEGVNTAENENAPVYLFGQLYFARGDQPSGKSDIYVATVSRHGKVLEPAVPVAELNTTETNDAAPTIRIDGREIFFWRGPGTSPDIWTSTRRSVFDKWCTPVPVTALNTTSGDTTCFLSWDAQTMIFDSNRPGSSGRDLWISTRTIDFRHPHWDPWD